MSAQTINGARASAYPRPIEELMPEAIVMARRLGEIPSRNALMRAFRIGAPKAGELREALIAERYEVEPERVDEPVVEPAEAPVEPAEDVETDPAPDEPDERPKRSRRWFRRRPRPQEPAQVTPHGHPGTAAPQSTPGRSLASMLRLRWAVRAVLTLGVAASIAGNVLHANDGIISQIISAWSPLALLLTVELISRVPVHRRSLAAIRWAATAVIAGIAAWVSYWHMAAVASHYGETGGSQYLLPLSVDGLIVVASICLVELGGRIEAAQRQ